MRQTSDQRAAWMNDSCFSVPSELRPRRMNRKNRGSSTRPHHLTELNTVSATARPSTLRSMPSLGGLDRDMVGSDTNLGETVEAGQGPNIGATEGGARALRLGGVPTRV